jgi:TRAP-type C4-dicarboxylate transport system permease small subunit
VIEKVAVPGGLHGALDRALRPVEALAAIIGGVMMLAAMTLTALDAILRYSINAPLVFNFYLTEKYLLVGMIMMPMAWGFRTGGFIRLMGVAPLLTTEARYLLFRAGLFVSFIYVAVLAWLSWVYFLDTYRRGLVQMGIIDWPVYWSWIWVPVGLFLLALRLLLTAVGPATQLDGETDAVRDAT